MNHLICVLLLRSVVQSLVWMQLLAAPTSTTDNPSSFSEDEGEYSTISTIFTEIIETSTSSPVNSETTNATTSRYNLFCSNIQILGLI